MKAMGKDPSERFQTMLELIATLRQCEREIVASRDA